MSIARRAGRPSPALRMSQLKQRGFPPGSPSATPHCVAMSRPTTSIRSIHRIARRVIEVARQRAGRVHAGEGVAFTVVGRRLVLQRRLAAPLERLDAGRYPTLLLGVVALKPLRIDNAAWLVFFWRRGAAAFHAVLLAL